MVNKIKQLIVAFVIQMLVMTLASIMAAKEKAAQILSGNLSMKSFLADSTAENNPKVIVGLVVALTVGLIVIGYLFPVGMTAYHAINFTACGMTPDEIAIYGVLGIFAIICLLLAFIGIATKAYSD